MEGTLGTDVAGFAAPWLKPPELDDGGLTTAAGAADGLLPKLKPPDEDGPELGREKPLDDDDDDDRLLLDEELLLELPAHAVPSSAMLASTATMSLARFIDPSIYSAASRKNGSVGCWVTSTSIGQ